MCSIKKNILVNFIVVDKYKHKFKNSIFQIWRLTILDKYKE